FATRIAQQQSHIRTITTSADRSAGHRILDRAFRLFQMTAFPIPARADKLAKFHKTMGQSHSILGWQKETPNSRSINHIAPGTELYKAGVSGCMAPLVKYIRVRLHFLHNFGPIQIDQGGLANAGVPTE